MISRPISQGQGLMNNMSGFPPSTANSNRLNINDKRHYISAIQNHMQQINEEINRLNKQMSDSKLEATNYEEVKKQSEKNATKLAELEEELMIYNTGIETVMYKGSKQDIDAEAENIRASKLEKIQQLEEIYVEKLRLEEEISKITKDMEMEKQIFENKIMELSEEERNEYFSLKEELEKLRREEQMLKETLKNYKQSIQNYEQQIFQSEKKSTIYNLSLQLSECQKKLFKIQEEKKLKRTPSQEREFLLEQVKQDRADTEVLKSQYEEEKHQLEKLKERYNELEDELSEKNSARLNKYKELLKRQETMSTFLEAFPKLFNEELDKAKKLSNTIAHYLEYMSVNSMDSAAVQKYVNPMSPKLSNDDVQREYRKYKMQLDMLNSVIERHKKELDELNTKEEKLKSDLVKFQDVEQAKYDLQQQQIEYESKMSASNAKLKSTVAAVKEAEKRKSEIMEKLELNDQYKVVVNLEKKLQEIVDENEKLQQDVNNSLGIGDYQKFKISAMEEVKLIFEELKSKLQKK